MDASDSTTNPSKEEEEQRQIELLLSQLIPIEIQCSKINEMMKMITTTEMQDQDATTNIEKENLLFALPEKTFYQINTNSNNDNDDNDNNNKKDDISSFADVDCTGTRPYSGAIAFLYFVFTFPEIFIFNTCSIIELGAGIGACGLYIAKLASILREQQKQKNQNQKEQQHPYQQKIVITDGELISIEICKRNRILLFGEDEEKESNNNDNMNDGIEIQIKQLLWSLNPEDIIKQLFIFPSSSTMASIEANTATATNNDHNRVTFTHVIGTDLLYYKTNFHVLLKTADCLLKKYDATNINQPETINNTEAIGEGGIFFPAIIRSNEILQDILAISEKYNYNVSIIKNIHKFISKSDLEYIVGWYNIKFLIFTRKNVTLLPRLQELLFSSASGATATTSATTGISPKTRFDTKKLKVCFFHPDDSSDDDDSDDDSEDDDK